MRDNDDDDENDDDDDDDNDDDEKYQSYIATYTLVKVGLIFERIGKNVQDTMH